MIVIGQVLSKTQKNMTIFNFNDYLKNPIADYCISAYKSKTIYTLNDLMDIIQNLKHSRQSLENNRLSFVGDQLRLYLASLEDNFLYVDADCYIPEEEMKTILQYKNCTGYCKKLKQINNGTFFHSDKDCRFNKYYLELYDKIEPKEYTTPNSILFNRYPFELRDGYSGDMKLLENKVIHFYLSNFYLFYKNYPNIDTIYYTKNGRNISLPLFWKLENVVSSGSVALTDKEVWFFETKNNYIPQDDMIRLWKEQLNYIYKKNLKFIEI